MNPPPPPSPPWPMPPQLRASVGVHAVAGAVAITRPELAVWALGGVALNQAALTAAGLWPRCDWLGANLRRLPAAAAARGEIALTLDVGPDPEVTPAVQDLLAELGWRATFFCIAQRAQQYPALLRRVVQAGHGVQTAASCAGATSRRWDHAASSAKSAAHSGCWGGLTPRRPLCLALCARQAGLRPGVS